MTIYEVPSGTQIYDWTVPNEWNTKGGILWDQDNNIVINFRQNNLHVVGYSEPVDRKISLADLQEHLYSRPDRPDAIPYVTSYYEKRWGFCLSHNQRVGLKDGTYHVLIDSTLEPGSLTYGEAIIPGETEKEIFISTYICHPSMANDNVSGMVVAAFLADWIASQPRKHTYRIAFVPETIGSLCYLKQNLHKMRRTIAGFNLLACGDDRGYSFICSRYGNTLADELMRHVLGT